jgi:hypothetical protein
LALISSKKHVEAYHGGFVALLKPVKKGWIKIRNNIKPEGSYHLLTADNSTA